MHSFNFGVLIFVIVLVCGLELAEALRMQSLVRRRCSRLDASYYKELEYDTLHGIHFTDLTEVHYKPWSSNLKPCFEVTFPTSKYEATAIPSAISWV